MNTGMLWYDDDPKLDFVTKVNKAKDYYIKKYGQSPNLCFVNPIMKFDPPSKTSGIDVQTDHMIMPNHFWLGIKGLSAA